VDNEQIETHSSSDPTVRSLCHALSTSQLNDDCLAFVLREKSLLRGTHPTVRDIAIKVDRACVSLHNLLDQSTANAPCITKEECLHLAVIISSSLLQLYETPWLPQNWCTQSIYFTSRINNQDINIECPYVTSKIVDSTRTPQTLATLGFHPDLVALGIMLLELSEKQLIHQWYYQKFSAALPEEVKDKAYAAWRWFENDACERMAPHYRLAFRSCLSVYELDVFPVKRMTLADERFREAVFRNIVLHLEEAYLDYTKPLTLSTLHAI
jgi:hypothetical protein